MAQQSSNPRGRAERDTLLKRLLHGRMLSVEFFQQHWLPVIGIALMLIIYIMNRYENQTKMETIQKLERDLEVSRTEFVRAKSAYMSSIRESQMQHLVDSLHLGLTIQEQPPFEVKQ